MESVFEGNLSKEQQEAMQKGHKLYTKALQLTDTEERETGLDLMLEAFETLNKYVNEVDGEDGIYYKIIFANVVQSMQDEKCFEISDNTIEYKIYIYLKTLDWFRNTNSYRTSCKGYLWGAFNDFAKILLKGEEMPQNDGIARMCFLANDILEYPLAKTMLKLFVQDESGNWVFTGIRPE